MSVHLDIALLNDDETPGFYANATHDPFIEFCQSLYDWLASTHSPFQEYQFSLDFLKMGFSEGSITLKIAGPDLSDLFQEIMGFVLDFCVDDK